MFSRNIYVFYFLLASFSHILINVPFNICMGERERPELIIILVKALSKVLT